MNELRSLSDLSAYLKGAVKTFSQHDYERLYQELRARYEQQIIEAFMENHPGWSVVEGNLACAMYLYRNWSYSKSANKNVTKFVEIVNDIDRNYEKCDEIFLSAEAVVKIMNIADRCYHLSNHLQYSQHIFIFLLQAKHRKEDSFCRNTRMMNSHISTDIYMLIPKTDHEATPQSMFLHELGHCVGMALTGESKVLPEDFELIASLAGVILSQCDKSEFFAHCFAMSLPIEPELANHDPFKMVSLEHKKLFRAYFQYRLQMC